MNTNGREFIRACPNCGSIHFYQRNACGPPLWYCQECESDYRPEELEVIERVQNRVFVDGEEKNLWHNI